MVDAVATANGVLSLADPDEEPAGALAVFLGVLCRPLHISDRLIPLDELAPRFFFTAGFTTSFGTCLVADAAARLCS